MAVHKKYQALGRGLDALISSDDVDTKGSSSISEISIDKIIPNPNQPRREMDEDALQELAESIKQIGIIQPITLRQLGDGSYQIIAGERRWRASKLAGLLSIPAYIRSADDNNVMQMALVENIQREDLNPIEIALAYQNMMEQFNLTQDKLSQRVGKKRATVANFVRLLKLPAPVQMALQRKEIDQGHARALLSLSSPSLQVKLFHEIQKEGLSVRMVEERVKALNSKFGEDEEEGKKHKKENSLSEEYDLLRNRLSDFFQTKVKFSCSRNGKGNISIPFKSEEELERIVSIFDKMKNV